MQSHSFNLKPRRVCPFDLLPPRSQSLPTRRRFIRTANTFKKRVVILRSRVVRSARRFVFVPCSAFDEDSFDIPSLESRDDNEGTSGYMLSSSDGEDSEGEIVVNPVSDMDLPKVKVSTNDALTVTAHRLITLGKQRKKRRIKYGFLITMKLIAFLMVLLLVVDWQAWRIVRLPLDSYHLTRPFMVSAITAAFMGYICIPLLDYFHVHQVIKKEGPSRHFLKKRTPTMGGVFFVPVGVIVAQVIAGHSCLEVAAASAATVAFAVVGLLDDIVSLFKNESYGLPAWTKVLLEVAIGTSFSLWLDNVNLSSPYGMRMLVPLPSPLGLVYLGKFYMALTSFCFVSMGNGINLTDGLDGLAGGTAALSFVAMSVAVLPICPDLAIFGASMAGSCVGFLVHNRYKASIFMGDTGSLALGGALAAMAACTGMFFPLLLSSGVFVIETLSVILQVSYFKTTKVFLGTGLHLFRMAPFHHHLELSGINEPMIVGCAYVMSSILSLLAGYMALRVSTLSIL